MTIMTENFEATDAAMDGGYDYTDRYGNKMKSLEGMARWQPSNGFRKGGAGTYHMEAEYGTSPEYKNIRRAIQIMNPSSHSYNFLKCFFKSSRYFCSTKALTSTNNLIFGYFFLISTICL